MALINENYLNLAGSYLFVEIAQRVQRYQQQNPQQDILRLGIGDVTRPLCNAVIQAMHRAVDEMAQAETFRGYGPERGYDFLIDCIRAKDFASRGVHLQRDEIFVSDGAKCDSANIQEIFAQANRIALTDPVYPVYLDSNVMAGRAGQLLENSRYSKFTYLECTQDNSFNPSLPQQDVDLIYLCFPNNPTGTTLTVDQLRPWVQYAQDKKAIILFDAAYEAFIQEEDVVHSIYEIEGAQEVAIEMRSFSKTAGFTGTRCAYTVVPQQLKAYTSEGKPYSVNQLWHRRQSTKFNGVSYVIQRAAEAVYSPEGQEQIQKQIRYYMENARIIREGLQSLGVDLYGGVNAPYVWIKTPEELDSWGFFDVLLNHAGVVGTPGVGFGGCGEGYFRLSALGLRETTLRAIERISKLQMCA